MKKCMEFRVEGRRPVGRSRRTWLESVETDMAELKIDKECTVYKRCSGHKLLCKLCRTFPPQQWGPDLPFLRASRPCGPAGWLALLLTKAGDVETNPGPTT